THRTIDPANLSAAVLEQLTSASRDMPAHSHIVLLDDRGSGVNLATAFGTLADDAYQLAAGREMDIWIDPAVDGAALAGLRPPCRSCVGLTMRLRNGRLEQVERAKK